ncbi:hypothetical protein GALL_471440 [mine drainage metagenome]|uniref:Uncharacterized protein n=1 Tax=mine drainage metagenome TaxID=410659 RepID=A0A1J5PKA6_9ZZZZ
MRAIQALRRRQGEIFIVCTLGGSPGHRPGRMDSAVVRPARRLVEPHAGEFGVFAGISRFV